MCAGVAALMGSRAFGVGVPGGNKKLCTKPIGGWNGGDVFTGASLRLRIALAEFSLFAGGSVLAATRCRHNNGGGGEMGKGQHVSKSLLSLSLKT